MPYFILDKIQLGPITFYIWGALLGLAFLIGYLLFLKQAKQQGIEENKIFWLAIVILVGSLLGSRLGYVLQFPNNFSYFFQLNGGGLMFYGGLLGALIFGYIYLKKARLNFWQMADLIVPSLALGIFITRIGCFLINDHQGAITNLFWAIQWPDGSLRHPIALYLALNGLIMFLVFWFFKNRFKKSGQIFIAFLIWYVIARFFLDFFRATDTFLADPQFQSLFISQWISLAFLLILFNLTRK